LIFSGYCAAGPSARGVKRPHFSPFTSEPEFEDEQISPGKAKVALKTASLRLWDAADCRNS
jgi:hypothetical protein